MSGILKAEFINAYSKYLGEPGARELMKKTFDEMGMMDKDSFTKQEGLDICSHLVMDEDRQIKAVAIIIKGRLNMRL